MEKVNIVCMKWGDKYPAEYVNILYRMVARNLTLPFRFICMTEFPEGINKEIEIIPLPDFDEPREEHGSLCLAWRKLSVFDQDLYGQKGKILFLDLDVIIVDNIDCFFNYSDKLAIIENWSQPGRLIGQASAFCFEVEQYSHLLEKYRNDQTEVLKNNCTEQFYITRELGKGNFDFFPDSWCKSFKFHCMYGGFLNSFLTPKMPPAGSKIIVFHGSPNPPEALNGEWGSQHVPWYKKFYKTVKPTKWIADYWY